VSESLRLFNADGSVRQDPYLLSESIARGELVYPEPWLYTRTGPRFSFWPFRGRFIQVGTYAWRFSTPLLLCRVAFVIGSVAGLYFLACLLFGQRRTEAADPLLSRKRVARTGELNLGLPKSHQTLLAGGDRFLRRVQP